MAQASDPLFAGIPSLADDQQLPKNSTNNRDSEIQYKEFKTSFSVPHWAASAQPPTVVWPRRNNARNSGWQGFTESNLMEKIMSSKSQYLREFLVGRGVPAERLSVGPLTYSEVQKMGTMELEWNELTNAENLRAAIDLNPQERARRKDVYIDAKVTRLISPRATPVEAQKCSANIQTVFERYPWTVDCNDNAGH